MTPLAVTELLRDAELSRLAVDGGVASNGAGGAHVLHAAAARAAAAQYASAMKTLRHVSTTLAPVILTAAAGGRISDSALTALELAVGEVKLAAAAESEAGAAAAKSSPAPAGSPSSPSSSSSPTSGSAVGASSSAAAMERSLLLQSLARVYTDMALVEAGHKYGISMSSSPPSSSAAALAAMTTSVTTTPKAVAPSSLAAASSSSSS